MIVMSSRLRAIAHDTVAIVERGGYTTTSGRDVTIADDVARAVAGSRLYLPDDEVVPTGAHTVPVVEVTNESTLAAARRLGADVACLVFASAKNPGGGFLTGAQAQEESIARASALHACLTSAPDFYAFHRAQHDLRYSDRVIYSPGVPVFRNDDGALLDAAYPVTFLTAAAPNAGAIAANQPGHLPDVPAVLRSRALRILRIAAAHGHRRLVLGAWGCGVFRNDAVVVAESFADAMRRCDRFDRVTFAVLDRQAGTPTYRTFIDVLTVG
jgi:uncharacterized protein (TIGR02452 family)